MCAACAPSALVAGFCPQNPSRQTYCTLPWADDALMRPRCAARHFASSSRITWVRAPTHTPPPSARRGALRWRVAGAPLTARPVDLSRPPNVVADYASCAASPPFAADCQRRSAVKGAARPTRRTTSRRRRAHPDVWVRCRPTSSVPPLPARPLRRARDRSGSCPASCCVLVRRRRPLDRPAAQCAARLPIPCPAAHPPDPPLQGGASTETRQKRLTAATFVLHYSKVQK